MPTTTYLDSTFAVSAIGNRTDATGADVTDYRSEEARFAALLVTAGYIKPANSFVVRPQAVAAMSVRVGSDGAKTDYYVVEGEAGGQGNYIVRLDAGAFSVAVPAADASQQRTDEVYLVVRDDNYDASSFGLPQIGYRKGDLGGASPGPDSTWKASALLASINVAPGSSTVTTGDITDERSVATLVDGIAVDTSILVLKALFDAKGDLVVGTGSDTVTRLPVGGNGRVLVGDSSQTAGVSWSPVFAPGPINLTDTGTVSLDASQGETFRLSAAGNRTISVPSNPKPGQAITIEHHAAGGARTLSLATGTGGFLFGSDISELSATVSGKRDFIRAIYHSDLARWLVVGYLKGF